MIWAKLAVLTGSGCALEDFSRPNAVSNLRGIPEAWSITPGNVCERKVFDQTVKAGAMIVADRQYSHDHDLLAGLQKRGVHFVLRLYNNLVLEPVGPVNTQAGRDNDSGCDDTGEGSSRAKEPATMTILASAASFRKGHSCRPLRRRPSSPDRDLKGPGFVGGSDARRCPGGRRCSGDGIREEVSVGVA